jgi:hypothetical protein
LQQFDYRHGFLHGGFHANAQASHGKMGGGGRWGKRLAHGDFYGKKPQDEKQKTDRTDEP